MTRMLLVAGAFLLFGGGLRAQDDSLDKINKDARLVFARGTKGGPDPVRIQELVDRALNIATDHKGDEIGFDAYELVLNLSGRLPEEKQPALFTEVMDSLIESYLDNDQLGGIVIGVLAQAPEHLAKSAADYFDWIERDTKSKAVQAACAVSRAMKVAAATVGIAESKKCIQKFEELKELYGEQPSPFGGTFGKQIDEQIEGLKLTGTDAMEIAANDLDGVGFKLSDYHGKAVLLDFWGYW